MSVWRLEWAGVEAGVEADDAAMPVAATVVLASAITVAPFVAVAVAVTSVSSPEAGSTALAGSETGAGLVTTTAAGGRARAAVEAARSLSPLEAGPPPRIRHAALLPRGFSAGIGPLLRSALRARLLFRASAVRTAAAYVFCIA